MPSKDRSSLQHQLHTVIYSTTFSPCGKYLAAGNKFGDVAIFSLQTALSPDTSREAKCPVWSFSVYNTGSIYSLTTCDQLLIVCGSGNIQAYKWTDIIGKTAKLLWSLVVPKVSVFSNPEVNACVVTRGSEGDTLYAGAGDNCVHVWDLECGKHKGTLSGHTDYIHNVVSMNKGQSLVSVSEDGTARIWDLRTKENVSVIKPFEDESCCRPDMGKWLQCLAVSDENYWLLLGGGPTMAAWHLKTLTPAVTFDTPGVSQHVALFHEDKIFSAGSSPVFNHWSQTGTHHMAVPVTPSCVFSLGVNTRSATNQVMVAAGSSSQIDVCTNFGYSAFSLTWRATSV